MIRKVIIGREKGEWAPDEEPQPDQSGTKN